MPKFASSARLAGLLLLSLMLVACGAAAGATPDTSAPVGVGQVAEITYADTFETSGSIAALNRASLTWSALGEIASVTVEPGDPVQAGQILMTLDPASVAALANAEKELESAQAALENLTQADGAAIAAAHKNLAGAFAAWRTARLDWNTSLNRYYASGDRSLYNAWYNADQELTTALNILPLANADLSIQAAYQAQRAAALAQSLAESAQAAAATAPNDPALQNRAANLKAQNESAQANAQSRLQALNAEQQTLLTNLLQALNAYESTANEFVASLSGDAAFEYAVRLNTLSTAYADAAAKLESAIASLYHLLVEPDAEAYAAAAERLQTAQENLQELQAGLQLTAPFDGQVVAVGFQAGDQADAKTVAVDIVDRQNLYLTLNVEEARLLKLKTGQVARISLQANPETVLNGTIAYINPIGQASQGIVYYSIRIEIETPQTEILIGASADISIEVEAPAAVLVVPVTAVQNDDAGEFVYLTGSDGQYLRVDIVSGLILADNTVIVTPVAAGSLKTGDAVALFDFTSSSQGGAFGIPGGMGR